MPDANYSSGRVRPSTVEKWQKFLDNPDDPWHGTWNGYQNYKCRCERCRAANVERSRASRERRSKNIPADRHGKYTTYTNYSCRCDLCKAANREHGRVIRERRRLRSQ